MSNFTHCDICITELHLDLFEVQRYNYPNEFVVEHTNQVNWLVKCAAMPQYKQGSTKNYRSRARCLWNKSHLTIYWVLLDVVRRSFFALINTSTKPFHESMHSFEHWYYTSRRQLKHRNIFNKCFELENQKKKIKHEFSYKMKVMAITILNGA